MTAPGKRDPNIEARIAKAIKEKFNDTDPDDWSELFKLKLLFCHRAASFQADSKKQPAEVEFRDAKREVLIELIDAMDELAADDILHTEEVLHAAMQMIEANIFRTFANKTGKKQ